MSSSQHSLMIIDRCDIEVAQDSDPYLLAYCQIQGMLSDAVPKCHGLSNEELEGTKIMNCLLVLVI